MVHFRLVTQPAAAPTAVPCTSSHLNPRTKTTSSATSSPPSLLPASVDHVVAPTLSFPAVPAPLLADGRPNRMDLVVDEISRLHKLIRPRQFSRSLSLFRTLITEYRWLPRVQIVVFDGRHL